MRIICKKKTNPHAAHTWHHHRELNRMKVHESFAVTKLTAELLDEYVEEIQVHPGDEVRIIWK